MATKPKTPEPQTETLSVRTLIRARLERLIQTSEAVCVMNPDNTVTITVTLADGDVWPTT